MMPDTNYENIERYLNGGMSPAEIKDFEELLAEDKNLQEELQTYREVNDILSKRINLPQDERQFRKQLTARQSEYFNSDTRTISMKPGRKRWYRLTAVAAAALILVFLWAPWQQNLLKQFGQIEMTVPTVRGDEQNRGLVRASHLFNDKNYKKALPLLDSAVQADSSDSRSRFYRGITLLHLHQEAKARADFQNIFQGQSIFRYKAAYFMALSYWQKDNKDSCRWWLQRIPPDAAVYPKAEKMLKETGK